jgi:hypothetical protein
MSNETSRTISTCAIWAAVACILTFSNLYRLNIQGDFLAITILVGVPAVLGAAAAAGTIAIWRTPKVGDRSDAAPVPMAEREAFRAREQSR